MGYTTEFEGHFNISPPLDEKTRTLVNKLAKTRRMKRDVNKLPSSGFEKYGLVSWGIEGEFFVDANAPYGQDMKSDSVLDSNEPAATQPGLWCQWVCDEDGTQLAWDGHEQFYKYEEWLVYLIEKILAPRGYTVDGLVRWRGENFNDVGTIEVTNNKVILRSW